MKSQKEKQNLETKFQKELLYSFIDTQERERERIAADLFDNVGASLGAVNMMLNQLKLTSKDKTDILKECKEIVQNTSESTRQISYNLLPPSLEKLGLVNALNRTAKNLSNQNFRVEINADTSIVLKKEVELALFRIAQEMMANTLKYAKATTVNIDITTYNDAVKLEYFDNDIGFSIKESTGLGLKNIITRVEMIQVNHQFYSVANRKSGVTIRINKLND